MKYYLSLLAAIGFNLLLGVGLNHFFHLGVMTGAIACYLLGKLLYRTEMLRQEENLKNKMIQELLSPQLQKYLAPEELEFLKKLGPKK